MTKPRDPAAMSPEDRLTELASVMANGYLRLLDSAEKELDQPDPVEAPCVQMVGTKETPTGKESA